MLATATTYNIVSQGITSYDTFEYNSIVQFGDIILGAGDNGLFIFDNYSIDDSKQYKSTIQTRFFDIFQNWVFRLRYMIINGFGNFLVRVNNGDEVFEHLSDRIATKIDEIFVKLGYGNRNRYFQFEFETWGLFKISIVDIFGEIRKKFR